MNNTKSLSCLFPFADKPQYIKIFQGIASQIRAISFKRDAIKEVEKQEFSTNEAIYFLFDNENNVYIGKSTNGIERIKNHSTNKHFWTNCIIIITCDKSFDNKSIDYLEHYYIQKIKNSGSYNLENKDLRINEPNISIFDKAAYEEYISEIDFLLKSENIIFIEEVTDDIKYYYPKSKNFKNKAKIYFKDGKFILVKNSIIVGIQEKVKTWKKQNNDYYNTKEKIQKLLQTDKITLNSDGTYLTNVDIPFNSISTVGKYICGVPVNGWDFFEDIQELREK